MLYLIEEENTYLIKNKVEEILKEHKLSIDNLIKYDLEDVSLDKVIDELDIYDFLVNKKVVLGTNATFLTGSKSKGIEHNLERFEKYINNPNLNNVLILTCNKLDQRKKIVDLVKKKFKVISTKIDVNSYIKEELKDYKIDYNTINYLKEYCRNDFGKIKNEISKLKMYKFNEKEINSDDIDTIVTKNVDDNIFALIDAIIVKDKKKMAEIYQELIKKEEVISIMINLSNQLRLIYQVKVLSKIYRTDEEIANYLGRHKYAIEMARVKGLSFEKKDLLNYLMDLANLDYNIKTGRTIKEVSFWLFILKF